MTGYTVLTKNGDTLKFPTAEGWNLKNKEVLHIKASRHGSKIATLNWDECVCIYSNGNPVEVNGGNSNR